MIKMKSVFVFAKAQVSAFSGGLLDYLVMIRMHRTAAHPLHHFHCHWRNYRRSS